MSHYTLVNDTDDDSFVRVRNSTAEVSDLYGFERTYGGGTINSVALWYRYRAGKSGEVPPVGKALIKLGTVYEGDAFNLITDGKWHSASYTWDTLPGSGKTWKWKNILSKASNS